MSNKLLPLSIITWKWKGVNTTRGVTRHFGQKFKPEHVNILYSMVKRNLDIPFTFTCITDDADGIRPEIKTLPIWEGPEVYGVPHTHPNCYKRLNMFRRDIGKTLGNRIISLDLDCVIVGNLTNIFSMKEDFVAWNKKGVPYQGGLIMLTAGMRPRVWETFNPLASRARAKAKGYVGSDQAWISYCLGKGEKVVTNEHGVYSFHQFKIKQTGKLPSNARIVFFPGHPDPWHSEVLGQDKYPWVKEHYRE